MILVYKFLQKYKNMAEPVKAAFWFTICNFVQKGINMVTVPIFTRLLTTEQYGVFTVYQSWYGVISIIATLNLYAGVFNKIMIKYDEKHKVVSSLNGLSVTVTAILFVIYLCRADYFSQMLGLPNLLIIAMFAELFFLPAFELWGAKQRFDYKYKSLVCVTIIAAFLNLTIGVLAVLLSEHKAEARVLSYVGVQVCIGIILTTVNFRKGRCFFNKEFWKYAIWFNVPLIPHYLSLSVLGQADRIMISKMIGMSEAAIYGLAYNISQIMQLLTSAVNNSFVPYTFKAIKSRDYKAIGNVSNLLLLAWGGILIIVICIGPELIRLFAPKDYYAARWIIPPVSLSVYYIFLYCIFGNVEFYFEARIFIMIASIFGAIINVLLNYIFIPIFGYIAAGYTTLVCYILLSIGHYLFHKIILKNNLTDVKIYNIKFIFILSLLLTVFALSITCVYDHILVRYIVIMIVLLILFFKRRSVIDCFKAVSGK